MRILFNTPGNPFDYPNKDSRSRPQVASFVFKALQERFGKDMIHIGGDPSGDDILVTQLSNPRLKTWKRAVVFSNDNFEVDKWKNGKWRKYGLSFDTMFHPYINNQIKGVSALIMMSNEVAMQKWDTNHKDVYEKKQWLLKNVGNIIITPHPIDKKYWGRLYDPNYKHDKPKMLIYHSTDARKNAKQLIDLLKNNGFKAGYDYDVTDKVNKGSDPHLKEILQKYTYLAHISVSEGFPYFASEFLCQGLILYGHEEWWNGYNRQMLRWSYDPKRAPEMVANLKKLLSSEGMPLYHRLRDDIMKKHLARKDNDWTYFNDIIIKEVERLM